MAATSSKIIVEINGVPTILEIDANLWGTGDVASRPGTGDNIGDIYIVQDPPLYAIDIWDGSAWIRTTIVGPLGGSVDNGIVRWNGTGGDQTQNSNVLINDSDQLTDAVTCSFTGEFDNGNSGPSETIDWNNGQKQRSTLSNAAVTYTFTAPPGPCNVILVVIQDPTGGRIVTWPASVLWAGGGAAPVLSTAGDAIDVVAFYFDGTSYYGTFSKDFA